MIGISLSHRLNSGLNFGPNEYVGNICCTVIPYRDGLQMILGPDFIAKDEGSYRRMVELESDEATAMWKRVISESAPEDTGDE